VIEGLHEVGLKLQPLHTKGSRVSRPPSYSEWPEDQPRLVTAVREFPTPERIKGVRQLLGLASYYRKFILQFAKIAQPLHSLNHDKVVFRWDKSAFNALKQKLMFWHTRILCVGD